MDNKKHYIINRTTLEQRFSGTYEECLKLYIMQDIPYRKLHKIISDEDYTKIIKRKSNNKHYD